MSQISIGSVSGTGHTFGDGAIVHNTFSQAASAENKVLTRQDYLQMLSELWDLGRISVPNYLADKYEKHIAKNPDFAELLYRDIFKVMEGVSQPEDGDLAIEDGDFVVELGDLKTTGHTNNFHDAMSWLHEKVVERMLDVEGLSPERAAYAVSSFPQRMEEFEKLFLAGGHDSPSITQRLKEFNDGLKAECSSRDAKPGADPTTYQITMNSSMENSDAPKVFISYAWDDDTKAWAKDFATRLRADGIDAMLDQWQTTPGDQLTHFMERAVRDNSYVLIICTPRYKAKSDSRQGGVGYEGDIMTAEVFQSSNHRKYIPVLLSGSKETSLPSWLAGKFYVDLANPQRYQEGYEDLVTTIFQAREAAPPLGRRPAFASGKPARADVVATVEPTQSAEDITIKGILVDGVTKPKNDGTKGSALYAIPFELNRHPSQAWITFFLQSWDMPPQFTTMHRPGIASVRGNKIILDGTDIEEVERYHRDTLKLCVLEANKKHNQLIAYQHSQSERERQHEENHKQKVESISRRINFD